MTQVRSYSQLEAPEVEVLWDGHWCWGTLHEWRQDEEGRWSGWIRYHVTTGENRIGVFDQDHIRPAADPPASRPGEGRRQRSPQATP